jgi:peroxiredoxin
MNRQNSSKQGSLIDLSRNFLSDNNAFSSTSSEIKPVFRLSLRIERAHRQNLIAYIPKADTIIYRTTALTAGRIGRNRVKSGNRTMFNYKAKKSGLVDMAISAVLASVIVITVGCKKNTGGSGSQDSKTSNNSESIPMTIEQRKEMNPFPAADVKPGATLQQIGEAAITWSPQLQNQYGKDAPDFALKDLQGKQHRLSDYKGRNVMVVFWATWCPPCKKEIPHLILLENRMPADKLKILAITNEDQQLVRKFVTDNNINYTVLLDNGALPRFYMEVSAAGIPSAAFIDPQGKIKFATYGYLPFEDTRAILQAPE